MRFDDRFDNWSRFGNFSSGPREAKGGIKAISQRGKFGESWWARRWIEALDRFNIGGRLQRGRSYARKGQVLFIDVEKGIVKARVQGSRAEPYQVTIEVRPLSPTQWKDLAAELSGQAIFAAKLLAGEMPQDVEQAFASAGLSMFPENSNELSTKCSCPDQSNPCKHIAAVYYLLGEAFDGDPFLIFRMRGIDRAEFTAMLLAEGAAEQVAEHAPPEPEPLPAKPEDFWLAKPLPLDLLGDINLPRAVAALPRRLGNLQFWRGEWPLMQVLEPSYENAARAGERVLADDFTGQ